MVWKVRRNGYQTRPARTPGPAIGSDGYAWSRAVQYVVSKPPLSCAACLHLISFDDGAMTFPDEDLPNVAKAAHEVVQEAKDAGVWVFGGGVESQRTSVMATDGTVTDRPYPETKAVFGGFAIVDVSSREEALEWAAKIAWACRCAQEVREFLPDPTV